jgi:hypothetical protein
MLDTNGEWMTHVTFMILSWDSWLFVNFFELQDCLRQKMVHTTENGQAMSSILRYFLSLVDHYIKSYSFCSSVEHHVFVLKWPPTIRATRVHNKFQSQELGKYVELRFFIFPGTAATRLTFWHPQTNQIPKHHLSISYGFFSCLQMTTPVHLLHAQTWLKIKAHQCNYFVQYIGQVVLWLNRKMSGLLRRNSKVSDKTKTLQRTYSPQNN